MTGMDFPSSPTNGQTTTDGRYYFDSSVGSTGAWRSTPLPVGGLPAGSIMAWGTNTPPANWLLADGTAVSRSTYSSLFAVIGIQYGAGDGTTTFNLPDLRGRVPVGKDGGTFGTLGASGGSETNTLTANNLPAHTHPITDPGHSHYMGARIGGGSSGWGTVVNAGYTGGADQPYWYSGGAGTGITVNNNTTTNSAVNNLQPYQVVNYIIKASAGWTAGDSELATRLGVLEQTRPLSQNYVLNGAFDINQRGISSSGVGTNQYGLDRWKSESGTGTVTQSVQQFAGSSPATGVEAKQYARIITSGQSGTSAFSAFLHKMEDVRTLANKPYTLSFYARVGSGTATISADLGQAFDNGGTGDTRMKIATWTATTSWQRFSATFTPQSIAGKTIGANSLVNLIMWQSSGSAIASLSGFDAVQNNTFDYWGVQVEEGQLPTGFRRMSPSIQAELAACQRYFQAVNIGWGTFAFWNWPQAAYVNFVFPEMRTAPSISSPSGNGSLTTSGNSNWAITGTNSYSNITKTRATIGISTSGSNYGGTGQYASPGDIFLSAEL